MYKIVYYSEWEDLESMGIARIQPGVATLGGKVYAVGGEQGSQILANGEVYDPKVNILNTKQTLWLLYRFSKGEITNLQNAKMAL